MDDFHLKLQLTTEDVRYIREKLLTSADAKLRHHLPPQPSTTTKSRTAGESDADADADASDSAQDPVRATVDTLVKDFIHQALELTRHGLIVDGVDMSSRSSLRDELVAQREEIEPFDFELNRKLRKMYSDVDSVTLEVARLRREAPVQAMKVMEDAIQRRDQAVMHASESKNDMIGSVDNNSQRNMMAEGPLTIELDGSVLSVPSTQGLSSQLSLSQISSSQLPFSQVSSSQLASSQEQVDSALINTIPGLESDLDKLREVKAEYHDTLKKLEELVHSVPEAKRKLDELNDALTFLKS